MHVPDRPSNPSTIARARTGEPKALEALYREHADDVMRLAYRITGSAQDAEDIVHDVFLGLPEALRSYEERGTFRAWLTRVAARVALAHRRRHRSRREVPLSEASARWDHAPSRDPTDGIAVEQALIALPYSLRVVFVLKEIGGCSHGEIATLLGIRTNTSQVRFHRALKRLRRLIGGPNA